MSGGGLHRLSASELVQGLARRELRAEDVMRDCLDRTAEREPLVHAFTHLATDAALAAARQLDAGPVRGLLHGLPLGVKDLFDMHDMPSSYGSPIYAGHRGTSDAAAVALCRAAGALVVGKTVTTEFATYEPGPTRNPHALDRTPGGSSSGSAAAVADCMLPLAIGTQTAGSIIRPAAFCGVVGFKPSFARVPRAGMKLLSESLDTIGGFARSVADVALLASVLTGDDLLFASAAAALKTDATPAPRIGWFQGPQWPLVSADTQRLWDRVTDRLAVLSPGASEVAAPQGFDGLTALQSDLMAFEAARSLTHERVQHADQLSAKLTALLGAGQRINGKAHGAMLAALQAWRQRALELFERHDVLIAPSAVGEAGWLSDGTGDPVFCRAWTLLGLPCLHLPLGVGASGLPIGLQLIGRPNDDAHLLQVGGWLHPRLLG